jgi:hypothetical protein
MKCVPSRCVGEGRKGRSVTRTNKILKASKGGIQERDSNGTKERKD